MFGRVRAVDGVLAQELVHGLDQHQLQHALDNYLLEATLSLFADFNSFLRLWVLLLVLLLRRCFRLFDAFNEIAGVLEKASRRRLVKQVHKGTGDKIPALSIKFFDVRLNILFQAFAANPRQGIIIYKPPAKVSICRIASYIPCYLA